MRRPAVALLASAAVLLALAVPFFDINTGFAGVSTLPDSFESKRGFELLDEEFDFGQTDPVEIVIDGSVAAPDVQEGIAVAPGSPRGRRALRHSNRHAWREAAPPSLSTPLVGDTVSDEAMQAVSTLRD